MRSGRTPDSLTRSGTPDIANARAAQLPRRHAQSTKPLRLSLACPTFTNTYVAPADKPADSNKPTSSDSSANANKQIPQTGDTNNAMFPIIFAAAAATCIVIGVVLSRKK